MRTCQRIISCSKSAFNVAIASVQPHNLMKNLVQLQESKLLIKDKLYAFENLYIVGFGKAVAGMVSPLEDSLGDQRGHLIKSGILSVPRGFRETFDKKDWFRMPRNSSVRMLEGAKDNLPDEDARQNAVEILNLMERLKEDDLLFVLISGGGSALLPLPEAPLTLEEKTRIILKMSRSGASIAEINTVRKVISSTKGGKLALRTRAKIVAFILSDIIGDSLDMIASGPTIPNFQQLSETEDILKKYDIEITANLQAVLDKSDLAVSLMNFSHVDNYLIGSNRIALNAVNEYLKDQSSLRCKPLVLSLALEGEAKVIGEKLAQLGYCILKSLKTGDSHHDELTHLLEVLNIQEPKIRQVLECVGSAKEENYPSLSLLFGGETTVQVKGSGKGGRNQELVLAASLCFERLLSEDGPEGTIVLLSGGTDGIDGPTDAAGALTYYFNEKGRRKLQATEAKEGGLVAAEYLKENDSYGYFSKLANGEYLLKPGHTGTNVMDIQVLWVHA